MVQNAGCRVQGAGCRVQGAGCRVQGAGCRVQGGALTRLFNCRTAWSGATSCVWGLGSGFRVWAQCAGVGVGVQGSGARSKG